MYHHLKSLKNKFSNNHLFYCFYHLLFACLIYGCNTENRSNFGDHPGTSSCIGLLQTDEMNGGNTPMHVACANGNTEFVIATLNDLIPSQRKEDINKILNLQNNDGTRCIELAAVNEHIDLIYAIFSFCKEHNIQIDEVVLESALRFFEAKRKDPQKIRKLIAMKVVIEIINDYRNNKNISDTFGKAYTETSNLNSDIEIVDEAEKPDLSAQCDKAFSHKSSLNSHIAAVHKGKTYSCKQCDKAFSYKKSLNRHIAAVHKGKTYSCEECKREFTQRGNLKRHIAAVHKGKTYPCKQCSKAFTQPWNLKTHIT